MDYERYPCLRMAFEAGKQGGTVPTVYSAANEVAVARFLAGEITFLQIEEIIERVMQLHQSVALPDLEQISFTDHWAREKAADISWN
ncbi:unnamed protein product [Aphanomyces euteiches]